jgi:DMSO/TMAO reductase YedYZ heme-binding membrane subunit
MQIAVLQSAAVARVIFVMGILNFLILLFLLSTCRCLPTARIGKNWLKNRRYQKIYKFHGYIWYFLAVSMAIHMFLAINYYGIPF